MISELKLREHLLKIYKTNELAAEAMEKLRVIFSQNDNVGTKKRWLDEKDVMLITYGDSLQREGETGIHTLHNFLTQYVGDLISGIHILPMFPYTSDDGFSVLDYRKINQELGNWEDIHELSKDYDLMFDAVINHISKSSSWFQKFLEGAAPYLDYFITADEGEDYSSVTRPRALPLLTPFETAEGKKYVWTTFSEDQIDLNFKSIDVLVEIVDLLLFYAKNGARYIRLDAIGFLWKEIGTTCMHLPETHEVIKLFRMILEEYAPGTYIITETNVPYKDNISYFGSGDEAHLVYQFPLPPLVMFSLLSEDAGKLSNWANGLEPLRENTTYFNFLSSHDGIGIRPAEGILNSKEQEFLVKRTLQCGGAVSYKDNGDGTKSPYELNINYQDALALPEESDEVRIKRLLAAETILLSLQGMPGIYIHSLVGSRNDYYGKVISDIPRRINREKLNCSELESELGKESNRSKIYKEILKRLEIRKKQEAFSPAAEQEVLMLDKRVFALRRKGKKETIYAIVNVSSEEVTLSALNLKGTDLFSHSHVNGQIILDKLQTMWILEEN